MKRQLAQNDLEGIFISMRNDRGCISDLVDYLEAKNDLRDHYSHDFTAYCENYIFELLQRYVQNEYDREIMFAAYRLLPGYEKIEKLKDLHKLYANRAFSYNKYVKKTWPNPDDNLRKKENEIIKKLATKLVNKAYDDEQELCKLGLAEKVSLNMPQIIPSYESQSGKLEIMWTERAELQNDSVIDELINELQNMINKLRSGQYGTKRTSSGNSILGFKIFNPQIATAIITIISLCFSKPIDTVKFFSYINELRASIISVSQDNNELGSNITELAKNVINPDYYIETKVRTGWESVTDLKPGDKVEFQMQYKNTDPNGLTHNNVMVRNILPTSLKYVSGSTCLWNELHDGDTIVEDDIVTEKGINIGHYAAGANAYVRFTAEVVEDGLACGSNVLVTWGTASVGDTIIQDSARVKVFV